MKITKNIIVFASAILLLMSSCTNSRKVVYLQDIVPNVTMMVQEPKSIKLIPGDKLSIIVHGRDRALVEAFNLMDGTGEGAAVPVGIVSCMR